MKTLLWILTSLFILPIIALGLLIPILNVFVLRELCEMYCGEDYGE